MYMNMHIAEQIVCLLCTLLAFRFQTGIVLPEVFSYWKQSRFADVPVDPGD